MLDPGLESGIEPDLTSSGIPADPALSTNFGDLRTRQRRSIIKIRRNTIMTSRWRISPTPRDARNSPIPFSMSKHGYSDKRTAADGSEGKVIYKRLRPRKLKLHVLFQLMTKVPDVLSSGGG
jgi:hypothetical protein